MTHDSWTFVFKMYDFFNMKNDIFRTHEWFKVDLQSYLFPSPNHHDDNIVDVDIVIELCEVS